MVDDDDGDGFPSPEPRTDSRSALPRGFRAWWRLCIIKRNESFSLIFFSPNVNIWNWSLGRWSLRGPTRQGARTEGVGTPPTLMGPLRLRQPQLQLHIFHLAEKKFGEEVSSRCTIRSCRQALISLGRADLESIRGFGEGDSSPSSSSTILHHQFHYAHRRA